MSIQIKRDQSLAMRHIVHVRNHVISVDGAVDEGGVDAGPNPHDLYDAALGACKALTMVWYAKRKNIPVEDIQISIDRDNSEERQGVYRLSASISLSGDLTEAQRQELLAVAEKCPVQKLMTSVKTEVTTTLA
ncbi:MULTISPECIES: OsmC family protein [unclassified Herbaspirillum]|uniref:OsmC family protein n=1 Tax=unclassified Herbaspirillum TaxID=2624150 RepID=UPI000E2EF029|nr:MULTISPECIES: OsmC family protein [unclassified Herbaspirillum]RFB67442.1 OsmC family peroxiredoxin [Herbaspirillum sp. 3R-3a1]TFI05048.1 OsmC family peroxiredoxin [Herbaspirillum sp. 3R11]TFI12621.1 OsmC family peroxiredoxin [Herbaspirillum sp. 3R-11]TFI22998.1 OsmC family peroxiredoxin [Herbaspirillum sp. 3C11]